eukprot:g804.t1
MASALKAKFISAIWGRRYIEDFCRISLPSYMARGNIPALTRVCDLEILICTDAASVPLFEQEAIFQDLRELCPVRFLLIDDLIVRGQYGVTLTLAYARAVMDSGAAQTETYFVFMNSDFVLADGSLAHLGARMQSGEPCIMAPSLRGGQDEVLKQLADVYDPQARVLAMPPRDMVRLTLNNLHPTAAAKTVTQSNITCITHNQVYWRVDEATLLGRYYLIFMLAIKPERPMSKVTSYCDYGFVPDLVPSGDVTVIDDSDDFFMLELQPDEQEAEFLRWGETAPAEIAAGLQQWTTKEHRRFADFDVVFHAEDLPPTFSQARADFAAFHDRLTKRIDQPPRDHADHPYWVLGFQSWWLLKSAEATKPGPAGAAQRIRNQDTPPEMRAPVWLHDWHREIPDAAGVGPRSLWRRFVRLMVPAEINAPFVPIRHLHWLDYAPLRRWTRDVVRSKASCLFVHEMQAFTTRPIVQQTQSDHCTLAEAIREARLQPAPRYSEILIHGYLAAPARTGQALKAAMAMLKPNGRIVLFLENLSDDSVGEGYSNALAVILASAFPMSAEGVLESKMFVGGRTKYGLMRLERKSKRRIHPGPEKRILIRVLFVLFVGALSFATALLNVTHRRGTRDLPARCTSATLVFRSPETDAAAGTDQGHP